MNAKTKTRHLVLMGMLALGVLSGCSEQRDTQLQDQLKDNAAENTSALEQASFVARFDPANSLIPMPNNLLFSGSADGTVNIPFDPSDSDAAVKEALNALDGFSMVAPITASFSADISADSISAESVRLFQLSVDAAGNPVGVTDELVFGVDFVATVSGSDNTTLVILPLKPLTPASTYMVALNNNVRSSSGADARAELPYALAKSEVSLVNGSGSDFAALSDEQAAALEPVRQLVSGIESLAQAYTTVLDSEDSIVDLDKDDIVLSWMFSTQSAGDVLDTVYAGVQSAAVPATLLAATGGSSPGTKADLYVGSIEVPYYLADNSSDALGPLTGYWQGEGQSHLTRLNTTPLDNGTQTIPMLLSVPNANAAGGGSKPAGGWPMVIFQHGVTQHRGNMLAVADTLADAGFAVVAIDLPLHGLIGNEDLVGELRAVTDDAPFNATERHFDMDLVSQDANGAITAQTPDGFIDSSGRHFINLDSLLTSRDNVRQAVADLFALTRAIPAMDYDGGAADFDGSKIYFVGHSLGAIVGSVFLAKENNVRDAVLAMPGGGIAKLLDGSPTFGPEIAAGLAAVGVAKGSADYESFMGAAQTALGSADPVNYAAANGNGRGLLLFEVVGDGADHLSDQVIPNNVWPVGANDTVPSPTAGTSPLATAMSLTQYNVAASGATDLHAWVRFSAGHHSSILTSDNAAGEADATAAAVTVQMQTAMAAFLLSDGTSLSIDNSSGVISPLPAL